MCFACLSAMNVNGAEIKVLCNYFKLNVQCISKGVDVYHDAETGHKYAILNRMGLV